MMGGYHGSGFGASGWIAMLTMMAVLIVAAGVMFLRGGRRDGRRMDETPMHDRAPERGPMDILDERFARNELDRDEYDARKAELRGGKQ